MSAVALIESPKAAYDQDELGSNWSRRSVLSDGVLPDSQKQQCSEMLTRTTSINTITEVARNAVEVESVQAL